MSDDLISRKAVIESVDRHTRDDGTLDDDISIILEEVKTAFDKEKVIEKIKDYRELIPSWALREIVEIIDKGGITVTKLDPKSEWISGDSEIRPQNKPLVVCILKNNRIGIFQYKKGVLHNLYVPTYYTWKMVECWMAIGIPSGVRDRVLLGVRKEL